MSEAFNTIRVGNNEIECTQENTSLYTHLGKYALYDHVFIASDEKSGAYVWRGHSQYDELEDQCVTNDCLMIMNRKEPYEGDVAVYLRHALEDADQLEIMVEKWSEA